MLIRDILLWKFFHEFLQDAQATKMGLPSWLEGQRGIIDALFNVLHCTKTNQIYESIKSKSS